MSELKETIHYDHNNDRMTIKQTQDVEPFRDENKRLKALTPEHGAYMGKNFVHACSVPEILIIQMMRGQCCPDGVKYNMLAPDPEEARRALVHLQHYHNDALVIKGKPFTKKRAVWA